MLLTTAIAHIKGNTLAPNLRGAIRFAPIPGNGGSFVYVDITGLPDFQPATEGTPQIGPFGFHIHEKGDCDNSDPNATFAAAGGHFNPTHTIHPNHAGDLPILFSNHGRAIMNFYTDKFTPWDVIGRSVIIHQEPDDFRTQPSGNSGKRIACGIIRQGL